VTGWILSNSSIRRLIRGGLFDGIDHYHIDRTLARYELEACCWMAENTQGPGTSLAGGRSPVRSRSVSGAAVQVMVMF
jgi:hypothetical protein